MQLRNVFRAAVAGIWLAGAAHAQGSNISLGVQDYDSDIPVEITSEELELNQQEGTATFTGSVIVKQGDITMTCARMIVEFAEDAEGKNEIQVIRMFGGVTFVSPEETAESENAVYTLSNEMLVMTGDVLVTQGATALSADRLTYDLASGSGQMEGNVKTVLRQGN